MTAVVAIAAFLGLLLLGLLRTLAYQEVRGRIARRVRRSVEQTIAAMPPELQDEWAEEWLAETAALESMPFSAVAFARNIRRSATELCGEPVPALAGEGRGTAPARRIPVTRIRVWAERASAAVRIARSYPRTLMKTPFGLVVMTAATALVALVDGSVAGLPPTVTIPIAGFIVVGGVLLIFWIFRK